MSTAIVWFRNNLRLHDNEALLKAVDYDDVIPLYVFDPHWVQPTSLGFPKTGGHRARFLIETVDTLRKNLRKLGSDLGVQPIGGNEREVLLFKGGEDEALKRINDYFWEGDQLKKYKFTRNGLMGANYSSKFSPWLANGSLSPRYIYWEVKRYEQERKSNVSTYWMIFELIWRDFFRYSAMTYGNDIFKQDGIQQKERKWRQDKESFKRWAEGRTGIPFIDANMGELNRTGYMSNRGRQNVASFLAQNLNIDWRMGAEYFESKLIDYDVCSNYGNWMYNATVGQDPRNRYFNILKQAEKYDKKGDYVRHWLPELKKVPAEFIHEPHRMPREQQILAEVKIGGDYPAPMIDLEASYKEIRDRSS